MKTFLVLVACIAAALLVALLHLHSDVSSLSNSTPISTPEACAPCARSTSLRQQYSFTPATCGVAASTAKSFDKIYEKGSWGGTSIERMDPSRFYMYSDPERWKMRTSASGGGSYTGKATTNSLRFVVDAIKEFNIRTMLDIPCGDLNWMMDAFETDSLDFYVGADITTKVIKLNKKRFNHHRNKDFVLWDFTSCSLPKVKDNADSSSAPQAFDLIHVRDVLQHLPLTAGGIAAKNILSSGAKYVISTTFPDVNQNKGVWGKTGGYFRNNLMHEPYNFPKPLRCITTHAQIEPDETCIWKLI